jgi:hypothetical protein
MPHYTNTKHITRQIQATYSPLNLYEQKIEPKITNNINSSFYFENNWTFQYCIDKIELPKYYFDVGIDRKD